VLTTTNFSESALADACRQRVNNTKLHSACRRFVSVTGELIPRKRQLHEAIFRHAIDYTAETETEHVRPT